MGKEKYIREVERLFVKSPVLSHSSIERVVNSKKRVKQYTKQLIRNLIIKGKIKKLAKGFYTSYNESSLAVFCFKPAYLGLQDALSLHNLWEQETIPVIITTRKARQGIRNVTGANVLIRRIDKKYFFGFDYYKQGEFVLPYSDVEKTFIDLLYFKEKVDKEIIKNIVKKIDMQKLKYYIRAYPKRFRERILRITVL